MRIKRRTFNSLAVAGAATGFAGTANAQAKPLTVGFGMALTGGLAPNGKAALLAMQIATEEINAKGGILGRPVKLVYYDDQSNPSTVPGLYTKLMDVDKVDIVVSGYATNMIAPAMPVVMQKDRTFFALFGLAVNSEFNYPRYFAIQPAGGPKPKEAFAEGFFEVAMAQNPKPQTLAMVGADAEFPRNALEGVRNIAKKYNLKIVYDKNLPADHGRLHAGRARGGRDQSRHLLRGVLSTRFGRPDPGQQRGRLQAQDLRWRHGRPAGHRHQDAARAAAERHRGLRLLAAVGGLRQRRGPRVREEVPGEVGDAGVDLLGYYLPPYGYALMQDRRAGRERARQHRRRQARRVHAQATFKTIVGDIKFNKEGEWETARSWPCSSRASRATASSSSPNPKTEVILWPTQVQDRQHHLSVRSEEVSRCAVCAASSAGVRARASFQAPR
jgi:branched-chain amino acid transport system substrate-binding protein